MRDLINARLLGGIPATNFTEALLESKTHLSKMNLDRYLRHLRDKRIDSTVADLVKAGEKVIEEEERKLRDLYAWFRLGYTSEQIYLYKGELPKSWKRK